MDTGEFEIGYYNPVSFDGNIAMSGGELKVVESNRETVYKYCDSRSDESFDGGFDSFGGFDDTDDLFSNDPVTSNFSDNSSDDFFS